MVPPLLRELVKVNTDVVILGLGDWFEIWDAAALKEYEEANPE